MSLLDGLSTLGKSIADTAQVSLIESQRADLEKQKVMLADQLAGARQDKQNVYTSGENEKQRTFTGGENAANRTSEEKRTGISAGAQITSANIQAKSALDVATLKANELPTEAKFLDWLTTKASPEQKAAGFSLLASKIDKKETYTPLSAAEAKTALGDAYDSNKAYQRGSHGKIEPIGGSLVNIQNQSESKFTGQLGEQDAKRVGEIQENTKNIVDVANKVRLATDQFKNTYTGPAAEAANAYFKALGALGVPGAADKANAAAAAQAIIAELTPKMRVPGSGSTSDYEMRVFAAALPGLLNLPGGNELVSQYWQRIADRAVQVQGVAEKYATEKKTLTGTDFTKDVRDLGPLFSKEELVQMRGAGKTTAIAEPPRLTEEEFRDPKNKGMLFTAPDGSIRSVP